MAFPTDDNEIQITFYQSRITVENSTIQPATFYSNLLSAVSSLLFGFSVTEVSAAYQHWIYNLLIG